VRRKRKTVPGEAWTFWRSWAVVRADGPEITNETFPYSDMHGDSEGNDLTPKFPEAYWHSGAGLASLAPTMQFAQTRRGGGWAFLSMGTPIRYGEKLMGARWRTAGRSKQSSLDELPRIGRVVWICAHGPKPRG